MPYKTKELRVFNVYQTNIHIVFKYKSGFYNILKKIYRLGVV